VKQCCYRTTSEFKTNLILWFQDQHRRPQQRLLRAEEAQGHASIRTKRTLQKRDEPPAIVGRHQGGSQQGRSGINIYEYFVSLSLTVGLSKVEYLLLGAL